jgi:hypothetical protein
MKKETIDCRSIRAHWLASEAALHSSLLRAANLAGTGLRGVQRASEKMLCGISPIGEHSPLKFGLSSKESST